jgi:hypothetical protein
MYHPLYLPITPLLPFRNLEEWLCSMLEDPAVAPHLMLQPVQRPGGEVDELMEADLAHDLCAALCARLSAGADKLQSYQRRVCKSGCSSSTSSPTRPPSP